MLHHEGLIDRAAHVHQCQADVVGSCTNPEDGGESQQNEEWNLDRLRHNHDLNLPISFCQWRRDQQPDTHRQ